MLTLIVARARNGAIGRGNTIPWHVPEDLKSFKRETLGGAIIMGRRTWESLPSKPLPNRLNLVVSRSMAPGPDVVGSFDAAVTKAQADGYDRIYAIGGAAIYQEALLRADRLLITEVDLTVADADTHFPEFGDADWTCVNSRLLDGSGPRCEVREYLRSARAKGAAVAA